MFRSRLCLSLSAGLAGTIVGAAGAEFCRRQFSGLTKSVQAAELIPVDVTPTPSPTDSQHRFSEIMRHGFPGTDNIRYLSDFVLSYDKRNRTAHWVVEHLTTESIKRNENVSREKCEFQEDIQIHPYFRSTNQDYKFSGFDRGHLAAAANHRKCQEHVNDTFYLSNMSPQVGKGFNRDSWNRLEIHVRKLTYKYKNVYVCTGPLYLPRREDDGRLFVHYQVIGPNNVAVPTHFFKVVLGETASGERDMEAYVMPNAVIDDATPLEAFMVPLDTIERAAGLLIFDRVDKLRSLNGKSPPKQLRLLSS